MTTLLKSPSNNELTLVNMLIALLLTAPKRDEKALTYKWQPSDHYAESRKFDASDRYLYMYRSVSSCNCKAGIMRY